MRDVFDFTAPVPGLRHIVERLFLTRHFRRFPVARNAELKRAAESDAWMQFVPRA